MTPTAIEDRGYITGKAAAVEVSPFQARSGIVIHTTDAEAQAATGLEAGECGSIFRTVTVTKFGLL